MGILEREIMRKGSIRKMKEYYDSFPDYFKSSKKNFENIRTDFPEILFSTKKYEPKKACQILFKKAIDNKSNDNITIVIAKYGV